MGGGDWTLPIPMVKVAGSWRFDPRSGADLMQTRRIGRNELAPMQTTLAYYDAQRNYARFAHDKNGVLEYAQKIASSPGKLSRSAHGSDERVVSLDPRGSWNGR